MTADIRLEQLWTDQLAEATGPDGTPDLDRLGCLVKAAYQRVVDQINLADEQIADVKAAFADQLSEQKSELERTRQAMQATLDNVDQGIIMFGADRSIPICNRRAIELLGLPPELMARNPSQDEVVEYQIRSGEFDAAPEAVKRLVDARRLDKDPSRYERQRPNGAILEIRTAPLPDGGGVRTYTDITDLRAREDELRRAEAEYRSLFENSVVAFYRSSFDGRLIRANVALARLNGFESAAELHLAVNDIAAEWYVEPGRREAFIERVRANGFVRDFVSEVRRYGTGERIWVSEAAWIVRGEDGAPLFFEGAVLDVTERHRAETTLTYLARHDALTGLASRAHFTDRLRTALDAARQSGGSLSVITVNLARFREVNDSLGHAAGDELLRMAARRILRLAGNSNLAARLNSDVFAVVAADRSGKAASQLCEQIVAALSRPFRVRKQRIALGANAGLAFFPEHGATAEELLRNADAALSAGRATGWASYAIYDEDIDACLQQRRRLAADLRRAAQRGEMSMYFQPIVDTETGAVDSAEALMRWRHPVFGTISPDEFIPIAEESDLMIELGEWALKRACAESARWLDGMKIAVNISPVQFRSAGLVQAVLGALNESGLPPDRLELEITETTLLSDDPFTMQSLMELRAIGVKLAVDDFGAGHSSFGYLLKFQFDKIKLDRSFIADLGGNRGNIAIARAVTNLATDLGAVMVAEGVETESQLAELRRLGCRLVQGYLFGVARPASELATDVLSRGLRAA